MELKNEANPMAVAASEEQLGAMISSNSRNGHSGTADRLPMAYRDGAMDAEALPSRMGRRLHYRDGRVEHLPSDDTEGGAL